MTKNKTPNKTSEKLLKYLLMVIVLIVWCIIFREIQKDIFFYPRNDTVSYNFLKNHQDFEEVNINDKWNNLNWWFYFNNQRSKKSPLVIFFQGNAQNSSNTMASFLDQWMFDNFSWYNVLIVDYPEYWYSEGKLWEKSMFKAADLMYEWAIKQDFVDTDNIIIIGYSIWTWVATYCASKHNVNWLILIAPYDRALSLYNSYLNIFYGPLKLLAKYKFDSLSYAKNIDFDVQVITSIDDEIIGYKLSQNLSDNFKKHKEIVILDNNVKHNDYFQEKEVQDTIKQYLSERL